MSVTSLHCNSSIRVPVISKKKSLAGFSVNVLVELGRSVAEGRTRNQVSPGSYPPFATVSNIGHFRSLHDAPFHPTVYMSTWL